MSTENVNREALVRCSAWLAPVGDPCSLYRGYTLRVEVKAAGAWHADTNWSEREIEKALAHAEETRNDTRRKVEDVRVIRMRFEVVGSGGTGANAASERQPGENGE